MLLQTILTKALLKMRSRPRLTNLFRTWIKEIQTWVTQHNLVLKLQHLRDSVLPNVN